MKDNKYVAAVVTLSDKGYAGERVDESGKIISEMLVNAGYIVEKAILLPDDMSVIEKALIELSDIDKVDLILTTGGTGFSKRDVTPEATKAVATREANGIAEAIRWYSFSITKRAMLSRAASVIRNDTLIVNLPGSPKAVTEALTFALDTIEHGLDILTGRSGECARK